MSAILEDPQLAAAMKEGTKVVHREAEHSPFMKRFMSGGITRDEYGRYLNSLYFIYKELEKLLDENKDDEVVKKVHFPVDLNREASILLDLEYYYGKTKLAEVTSKDNITPSVQKTIDAINDAIKKNPALVIAYSYTRYLGDLSGGQIIAKRIKKHLLGLTVDDAAYDSFDGLQFYNFEHIESPKEFKALYRARLDGAPVTQEVKDQIVEESVKAFQLFMDMIDEIQQLSDDNKLIATI